MHWCLPSRRECPSPPLLLLTRPRPPPSRLLLPPLRSHLLPPRTILRCYQYGYRRVTVEDNARTITQARTRSTTLSTLVVIVDKQARSGPPTCRSLTTLPSRDIQVSKSIAFLRDTLASTSSAPVCCRNVWFPCVTSAGTPGIPVVEAQWSSPQRNQFPARFTTSRKVRYARTPV